MGLFQFWFPLCPCPEVGLFLFNSVSFYFMYFKFLLVIKQFKFSYDTELDKTFHYDMSLYE